MRISEHKIVNIRIYKECVVNEMIALVTIFKEQFQNRKLIAALVKYELKTKYAGSTLGTVWLFLDPIIRISVFWFAFGLGIRGGGPVGDIPFIVWMQAGMIPWFYISATISQGATSIASKLSLASKMDFPLSIIPVYKILALLQTHFIILSLVFVLMFVYRISFEGFSPLTLIYYIFSSTMFAFALSFVTSTLVSIVSDAKQVISHIVRLIFFMTPIMWTTERVSHRWFHIVLNANPIYYLIRGYRDSFLYSNVNTINWGSTLYFWSVTLCLMLIGARFHLRFRKDFIDYI